MMEFGVIAAKGAQNVDRLRTQLHQLPEAARLPISLLFEQLVDTDKRIEQLTGEIQATHAQSETSQRLATIPGVGMLSATIIAATTPDVGNFDCARDYAAWLGLTPKPHSTGGKQKIGRISKMGNRYIRRLLYLGPNPPNLAKSHFNGGGPRDGTIIIARRDNYGERLERAKLIVNQATATSDARTP